MLPAEVVVLDKLPMLGSGKVDQLAMDKFVRDRMIRDQAPESPHDLAAANPAAAE
jgi:hypothetical protein